MSPKIVSTLALVMGLLIITTGCEEDPGTDCPAIAYTCPEGEEQCEDSGDEGCKEYTFGDGDCVQVVYCIPEVAVDAE